ncbi:WD40/YVTN/BNR-like repeat-containing protein, partial [Natronococcus sp.]|uniref:WD40/YVTN/BNR-like repeat-containing protein n=1 Tax=Natronococcus sp. TaxID=35747 RepID=UPI003A4D882A
AVTGEAGSETVHLINGSGEYLRGQLTGEGGVEWGQVTEPGGGSSALGIDFVDDGTGYVADTTSQVYETTDGGESWETIGVDGGSAAYNDIVARSSDEIYVAAGDGTVLRYNGAVWTKRWAGGNELLGADATEDEAALSGAEGTIYEHTARSWQAADTDANGSLDGIGLDESGDYPHAAVGAGGLALEAGEYEAEPVDDDEEPADWEAAESPVEAILYDVVVAENGYAVGEGGYVLERDNGEWAVAVEDGPGEEENGLNAVDATDLGSTVWFAGDSGAVGEYDAIEGQLTDHSQPEEMTSTWEAIAVTGEAGSETVHLVNGSGEYVNGSKQADGSVEWGEVVEPGGGSSALGIDFVDEEIGYVVDTTSQVYETTDGGESWETIGVDDGTAAYTAVTARSAEEIYVSAGSGIVLRYNGAVWTKHWAGGNELNAVDANDDDIAVAGAEGTIVERTTRRWASAETPTEATIYGIALNGTTPNPGLVVGNPGTIF